MVQQLPAMACLAIHHSYIKAFKPLTHILWCSSCLQAETSHGLASLCHSRVGRREADWLDDCGGRRVLVVTSHSCWWWWCGSGSLWVCGRLGGEEGGRLKGLRHWCHSQRFSYKGGWYGNEHENLALQLLHGKFRFVNHFKRVGNYG